MLVVCQADVLVSMCRLNHVVRLIFFLRGVHGRRGGISCQHFDVGHGQGARFRLAAIFAYPNGWHSIKLSELHQIADSLVLLGHKGIVIHLVSYRKEHIDLNGLVTLRNQVFQDDLCLLRSTKLAQKTSVCKCSGLIIKLESVGVPQIQLCLLQVALSKVEARHIAHHLGVALVGFDLLL